MRRMKKAAALLLASSMVVSLAACGKKPTEPTNPKVTDTQATTKGTTQETKEGQEPASTEADKPDTSKEVTLKLYTIGDEGGMYSNQALEQLNTLLKEKINATLEPLSVSWGDYREKMPLIYASGEAYDLAYTANWINYSKEAVKGAFLNINDLMQEYAPLTYKEMSEAGMLDSAMVNGGLYMVPSTKSDYTTHQIMYREDLRKKYNCPEITDYATLAQYCDAIVANEPDMLPINQSNDTFMAWMLAYENDWARPIVAGSNGFLTYKVDDGKSVFNIVETPEYEAFVKRQREWYQKGYWSRSVLSEKTAINDQFLSGKSAVTFVNSNGLNDVFSKVDGAGLDWELGYVSFDSGKVEKIAPTNNGMSIGVNSKNPERALMFMELAYQDQEVFNAMYYGIEDVTYKIVDGKKTIPEGADPTTLGMRNLGMGIQNDKFILPNASDRDDVLAFLGEFSERSVYPALAGFVVDDSEISAEIAALTNIVDEYKRPLDLGTVDPEKALPELKQKLKEAGIEKVQEELNKQIDAYWAAQK